MKGEIRILKSLTEIVISRETTVDYKLHKGNLFLLFSAQRAIFGGRPCSSVD